MNDPVKQLTFKYFGTQDMNNRLLPNADSVIADVNGLQILIVLYFRLYYYFKDLRLRIHFKRNAVVIVVL